MQRDFKLVKVTISENGAPGSTKMAQALFRIEETFDSGQKIVVWSIFSSKGPYVDKVHISTHHTKKSAVARFGVTFQQGLPGVAPVALRAA